MSCGHPAPGPDLSRHPPPAAVPVPFSPHVPGLLHGGPGRGAQPRLQFGLGLSGALAPRSTDPDPCAGVPASHLQQFPNPRGKQESTAGDRRRREGVFGREPLGELAQALGIPGKGSGSGAQRSAPHIGRAAQPHEQAGGAAHCVVAGTCHVLVPGAGGRRGQQQQQQCEHRPARSAPQPRGPRQGAQGDGRPAGQARSSLSWVCAHCLRRRGTRASGDQSVGGAAAQRIQLELLAGPAPLAPAVLAGLAKAGGGMKRGEGPPAPGAGVIGVSSLSGWAFS